MLVNENKLETAIKKLELKVREKQVETSEMMQVQKNLEEIKMQNGELQPGDTVPPVISPTNVRTNKPFTDAERVKSYNDNMPRAEAFLA